MNLPNLNRPGIDRSPSRTAFRVVKLLVGCYLGLSVLTLVAIALLRNDSADVDPAVWTRGTIVVASASLTLRFTLSAARGSRRGYLRLRVITVVMLVAIVVILAIPGSFPLWLKFEQSVCGLLLIGVVTVVNTGYVRARFAVR